MADDVFDVDPLNQASGMPWQGPQSRELTPTEKIDAMAQEPLQTTGKPPSPEAVNEAKRIAVAAAQAKVDVEVPQELPTTISPAMSLTPPDAPAADEDETPPEPEGIARARLGYAASEKRTTAERDHAAQAMVVGQPTYDGPLPAEVESVWGQGKIDATGNLAENTARSLIAVWGMDGFLSSAIHQAASKEGDRDERMEAVRAAFLKESRR